MGRAKKKGVSSLLYISEDETDFSDHGTADVTQSYAAMESCFGSIQYLRIGYPSHGYQTFHALRKELRPGLLLTSGTDLDTGPD